MQHIKYSDIGQFRNLVRDVQYAYSGQDTQPTLKFVGTVKVHGTNASVVILPGWEQYPQSRGNVITVDGDNAGFAKWHAGKLEDFEQFRSDLCGHATDEDTVVIYGEWAGKGIQKGVAVSEVDTFFYIFGVRVVSPNEDPDEAPTSRWLTNHPIMTNGSDIVDSREIWQLDLEIDFNNPKASQNTLIDTTTKIEEECPVGKHFGLAGTGEGVVWEHITETGNKFCCKVKGEKHSISKVKKLAAVDVEKLASIEEFVNYAVTENRLLQGFQEVCSNDADRKLLGQFIKWVSTDILKEESDVLSENGLTMRDVGSMLSSRARKWFFDQEEL